jgi:hypothetical protein
MERNKARECEKFGRLVYIYTYLIICLVVLISLYFDKRYEFNRYSLLGICGIASGVYISMYFGLKLGAFRFKTESGLKSVIDRFHISMKMVLIHICILILTIIILSINDTNLDNSTVEYKRVDETVVEKIQEVNRRTDIVSIVEIDGNYILTFSDKSKKLVKCVKNH